MKLYLAGERLMFHPEKKGELFPSWKEIMGEEKFKRHIRRRLFTYFYHGFDTGVISNELEGSIGFGHDLFLDSGAFSAFQKKSTIPVDQYAAFVKKYGKHFSIVSNLDVIGDSGPASWENLEVLEKTGVYIMPVFHHSDDREYLRRMVQKEYPYIALGGMVGAGTKVLQTWLDDIWEKFLTDSDGRPITKVHGFGLTDQKLMFRYPWYSVDSSSWLMMGIFGGCMFKTSKGYTQVYFSRNNDMVRNIKSWHYNSMPIIMRNKLKNYLAGFNVTPDQCAVHYSFRDAVNAPVYQEMERNGVAFFKLDQPTLF